VTGGLSGLVQHVVAADCPPVLPLAGPLPDASHAIEVPPASRILQLELQQPPLGLADAPASGGRRRAIVITVAFGSPAQADGAALTVAVLRPELFRLTIDSDEAPARGRPDGAVAGAWQSGADA
jgi:hypothetical protein